jgi:hypothetical protein
MGAWCRFGDDPRTWRLRARLPNVSVTTAIVVEQDDARASLRHNLSGVSHH